MAKIAAGILSTPRGKIAGVVGASWKGQGYLREKVIPANPNTTAQQAQRSKMKYCVAFAQKILASILIPYVSPFQKKQSGYNWFVKQNISLFSSAIPTAAGLKVTAGTLEQPSVEVTDSGSAFSIAFTISANPAGDNETLAAHALVIDRDTGAVEFASADYSGTSATVSVGYAGADAATNCEIYVFNSLDRTGLTASDVSTSFGGLDF